MTVTSSHDNTILHFFASELSSFLGRNASRFDFKQLFPRLAGVALDSGTGGSRLEPLQYGCHNVRGRGNEPIQLVTSWRVTRIGKLVDNKLPVEEVGLLSHLIRWHDKAEK